MRSENGKVNDGRWMLVLLGRIVGYGAIGFLVFGFSGALALAYFGKSNATSTLLPGVLTGVLFSYAALRSRPRQSADPDSQLLFNLVLWTAIVLASGCIGLALAFGFVDAFFQLPEIDPSWAGNFASVRASLVFLCLSGFQLCGVHLALVRVDRKAREQNAASRETVD